MATPARLVLVKCPQCKKTHWEIDCDYRGMRPEEELTYPEREYICPQCSYKGAGYLVIEKSPLLMEIESSAPSCRSYNRWWVILLENFPERANAKLSKADEAAYVVKQTSPGKLEQWWNILRTTLKSR